MRVLYSIWSSPLMIDFNNRFSLYRSKWLRDMRYVKCYDLRTFSIASRDDNMMLVVSSLFILLFLSFSLSRVLYCMYIYIIIIVRRVDNSMMLEAVFFVHACALFLSLFLDWNEKAVRIGLLSLPCLITIIHFHTHIIANKEFVISFKTNNNIIRDFSPITIIRSHLNLLWLNRILMNLTILCK